MKYLTFVAVHGAGHFVPLDQPKHSLDMARRFIKQEPFCSPTSPLITYIDSDGNKQTQKCNIADELCKLSCRNGECDQNGDCKCKTGKKIHFYWKFDKDLVVLNVHQELFKLMNLQI